MEISGGTEGLNRVPLSEVVSDCVKRWFKDTLKEAKAGDINMQVLVGQMYYSGYGVPRDAQKVNFFTHQFIKIPLLNQFLQKPCLIYFTSRKSSAYIDVFGYCWSTVCIVCTRKVCYVSAKNSSQFSP